MGVKLRKGYKLKLLISLAALVILFLYTIGILITSYMISKDGIIAQLEKNLDHKEEIVSLIFEETRAFLRRDIENLSTSLDLYAFDTSEETMKLEEDIDQFIYNTELVDLVVLVDDSNALKLYTQTGINNYSETANRFLSEDVLDGFYYDGEYLFVYESQEIINEVTGKVSGEIFLFTLINNNRLLIEKIESASDSEFLSFKIGVKSIAESDDMINNYDSSEIVIKNDGMIGVSSIVGNRQIVMFSNQDALNLCIELDKESIVELRERYLIQMAILLFIVIIAAFIMYWITHKLLNRVFKGINNYSKAIVSGDLDAQFKESRIVEIDFIGTQIEILADSMHQINRSLREEIAVRLKTEEELRDINMHLESIVEKRTDKLVSTNKRLEITLEEVEAVKAELEVMNSELQNSVKKLVETQNELVQSEKLAALGNVVIGISHKFNTPLGVSLTASTYTLNLVEKIKTYIEKEEINDQVHKLVDSARNATNQVIDSVKILCDMVEDLKTLTEKKTNEPVSELLLKGFLESSMKNIKHLYTDSHYDYEVICEGGVILETYSDVLYKILEHLVYNAIRHGFEDQNDNMIIVTVIEMNHEIQISVGDNGKGVSKKDIQKVFEPYFTTQMGYGKGGLGLYKDYYLVHEKLHGRIECESIEGEYTKFIMTLNKKWSAQ